MNDEKSPILRSNDQMGVIPSISTDDFMLKVWKDADRLPHRVAAIAAAVLSRVAAAAAVVVVAGAAADFCRVAAVLHFPSQHRFQLQSLAKLDQSVLHGNIQKMRQLDLINYLTRI